MREVASWKLPVARKTTGERIVCTPTEAKRREGEDCSRQFDFDYDYEHEHETSAASGVVV